MFNSDVDYQYFQKSIYIRNSSKSIDYCRVKQKRLSEIDRGETIVDLLAYALMPNHFHLLIHEKQEKGISSFMSKLGTAYSMYINKKYDRSGPVVCRPFRSKYVDSDEYLRWVISYIHLNPAELESDDLSFINKYPYSSFIDYSGQKREENLIVEPKKLPFSVSELDSVEDLHEVLSQNNTNFAVWKGSPFTPNN